MKRIYRIMLQIGNGEVYDAEIEANKVVVQEGKLELFMDGAIERSDRTLVGSFNRECVIGWHVVIDN